MSGVGGRAAKGSGAGGRETREVSAARRAAFEILRRVEEEGSFAAPLLANTTGALAAEDRGLCYELVLGVLRRRLWLDRAIEHFAGRSVDKLDPPALRALRLGLYQLRFLSRVPARAAVNESVNLAHLHRLRSAAPFINAVLRRAARETEFDPSTLTSDPLEKIAVGTSHPLWLVRRWAAEFGPAEAEAFARANNEPAPASFRVNNLKDADGSALERLRAAGVRVGPSRVAPGAFRAEGDAAGAALRALAAGGLVYLQDEASQLVAHVLGARAGERVLDACAAPGSKTTQIAALAGDGALVAAGDLHEHRLRIVEESCARLGVRGVRTVALDALAALPFEEGAFDRILVDAPCTGTGTLRHNPEIRWRLRPEDIIELSRVQRGILSEAARVVRPGGLLVYSTCSVEKDENEAVVASFLDSHRDFRQVRASPAPDSILLPDGAARTWPHRDDADGFYVAALSRE
ncbi:MAG TPA: 16S rRNA (cytosine(967)-C(5))-methyltransferase RsmB [Pyrinomonadaceae bacterium]|nr:16S rRNA (cytosine(967)-C(5))-methyltransferase RsmB [Pyrinomonadaceae bacterium]